MKNGAHSPVAVGSYANKFRSIMPKWISDMMEWYRLWLRIGTVGEFCEHGNEALASLK
jgi:hypothetical protein